MLNKIVLSELPAIYSQNIKYIYNYKFQDSAVARMTRSSGLPLRAIAGSIFDEMNIIVDQKNQGEWITLYNCLIYESTVIAMNYEARMAGLLIGNIFINSTLALVGSDVNTDNAMEMILKKRYFNSFINSTIICLKEVPPCYAHVKQPEDISCVKCRFWRACELLFVKGELDGSISQQTKDRAD
jgi:hypothetical protein